jgi:hypothetical protein
MMRKNHPLFGEINRVIKEDMINIIHLYNKYYKNGRPTKCDQQRISGPKALGITPFYGVLMVLFVGSLIGVVAFVIELIISCRLKNK